MFFDDDFSVEHVVRFGDVHFFFALFENRLLLDFLFGDLLHTMVKIGGFFNRGLLFGYGELSFLKYKIWEFDGNYSSIVIVIWVIRGVHL